MSPHPTTLCFLFLFFLYFSLFSEGGGLCYKAYKILSPPPGIKAVPLAVETWSPNHWTTREFLTNTYFLCFLLFVLLQPSSVQFSSVAQSYLTLCDPMDCSMPGFPVHHQLLESLLKLMSIKSVMSTISSSVAPFSSCLQSFPASGSFPRNQFFAPDGHSIGASASASVLPMNVQG